MNETLTIEYNLAELPSSQHRAGLAGLVLMIRWLKDEPDKKGICKITQIDETSATLQIDQEGLQFLFDKVYAATLEDQERDKVITNSRTQEVIPYKKEIEKEVWNEKKKVYEKKTFYIYPQVVPHGAFLANYDKSEKGVWIKLWREFVWSILYSRDKQRIPFQKRSNKEEDKNVITLWKQLVKTPNKNIKLSSTLFVGAEGLNAENVLFNDILKDNLLLYFWAFVAQIYVPTEIKYDRKTKTEKSEYVGYALVVPDVAGLETFCDEYPDVLQSRGDKLAGYRPKESVIDIAAEGGLDSMKKLDQRLKVRSHGQVSDLLLGVDVVHLERKGNNIRLWGNTRIDPMRPMIDEYARVKDRFTNKVFRRQRMLNVLNEKDWFFGYDSLLSKTESEQTIGNTYFQSDVRKAFEDIGISNKSKGVKSMETQTQEKIPKKLEEVIYELVRTYIREKLRNKYGLAWGKLNSDAERNEYNEKKGKVAREAFLAIRSRTDEDFIEYFTSSICSYHQFSLKGEGFDLVAQALYDEEKRNQVRTLTMLALSANGYSPKK